MKERLEAVLNSIYRTEGSWLPIGGLATDGTGEVVHGRLIKDRFYFPASGSRKEDGTFIEQPVSPDTTGVLLSFPAVSDGNLLRCGFREGMLQYKQLLWTWLFRFVVS